MKIYKQGQGNMSRYGAVALAVLVALYAAFCWYVWQVGSSSEMTMGNVHALANVTGLVGAVILLVGITWCGIWLAFFHEVAGEFLIDVDTELRKVVWPEVLPLFDPKTSAWGSTYVVIITTIILTVYIGVVDRVLGWVLTDCLLKKLLVG